MLLHGPQSDRNRLWTQSNDSRRQDLSSQRETEQVYESEITRLKHENASTKDQLQRALKELRAYQVKYPSPYSAEIAVDPDDTEGALWSMAPNVINPLLEAYDSRILELEDTLKQQTQKLSNFKERMESIMAENEELRARQLEELKYSSGTAGDMSRLAPSGPLNNELLHELNERVTILMEENAVLVEQKIVLATELDKQQALLSKQTTDVAHLNQKIGELSAEQQSLLQRLAQAETDRDEAARHALSCSDALGKAEQEIDELNEQLTVQKQRHKDIDMAYADLKKQLKNLSVKLDVDGDTHLQRVLQAEERVRELQAQLLQRTQEYESVSEVLRKLRLEYNSTRQDAEGMLQVMGGMERQLNEYAAKEDVMERAIRDAREKTEDALVLKEQCAVRDEQNRLEIKRLQDERRQLLARRQQEIEAACDRVRHEAEEHLKQYEDTIQALSEKNATYILSVERSEQQVQSLRTQCDRLQQQIEAHKNQDNEDVKALSEQVKALSIFKEGELVLLQDLQEQNKDLRLTIDKYRAQLDVARSQTIRSDTEREHELSSLRTTTKDLERQLQEKSKQLAKKAKDIEEIHEEHERQLAQSERHQQDQLLALKNRLQEKDSIILELQQELTQQETRHAHFVEQFQDKYKTNTHHLEAKLRLEIDRNKSLVQKSRVLEINLAELADEKLVAQRHVDDLREKLRHEEEAEQMLRTTVQELSQQLQTSQQLREEAVYRAARALEEVSLGGVVGPATVLASDFASDNATQQYHQQYSQQHQHQHQQAALYRTLAASLTASTDPLLPLGSHSTTAAASAALGTGLQYYSGAVRSLPVSGTSTGATNNATSTPADNNADSTPALSTASVLASLR